MNNMELKRGFFKEVKKGENISNQIDFIKALLFDKQNSLLETEEGKSILDKRKLIENLDAMFKEVINNQYNFSTKNFSSLIFFLKKIMNSTKLKKLKKEKKN